VKRFESLERTTAPDGTVLTLHRHDGQYLVCADGVELMSTRRHHSEERLAELACAPLRDAPGARVLVGGLGLGFTLRAALHVLAADASVVVAELVAAVIAWNANPDYALAGEALRDPRLTLRHADVVDVLREEAREGAGRFDAILLDVDNGAAPLTTAGNARLYDDAGIAAAVAALRPGGWLAYWAAEADREFERALRRAGLTVEVARVRAHVTTGPWHTLYLARSTAA
jgi:spermidine synthase